MAREFNPDPWRREDTYVDRTYPSGVAGARPKLTPRIHCGVDSDSNDILSGSDADDRVALFNRQLREGHAGRNHGEE